MKFKIGSNWVGPNEATYFIADIAANHDGSLERAFKLIELAKKAGAHAAKFQNFQASKIVSDEGFKSLKGQLAHQSKWKKSVFEVYKNAEINKSWTQELKGHCDKIGIDYFTSPYDHESVDLVDPWVSAYKIGSGDINFIDLLSYIASKKKPIIVASGASTIDDVTQCISALQKSGGADLPLCLMQCNTNYTGSLENFRYIHLNVLKTYTRLFPNLLLGISDHTPGHATVLGAIALGARVIEKHFTDDNNREGPDHAFSMNPITWRDMVDRAQEIELALGGFEKKIEANEKESAVVQRRSLFFSSDVKKGEVIGHDHLLALRPAPEGSISPDKMALIIGNRASCDHKKGEALKLKDWLG